MAETLNFTPSPARVPRAPVKARRIPPVISRPSFVVGSGSAMAAAIIHTPAPGMPRPASTVTICCQGTDNSYDALERGGNYWTPGNCASGATDNYTATTATQAAGWYNLNSGSSVHIVGQKPAGGNALGLYDMSGNVFEWAFTMSDGFRDRLGGSWLSTASHMQVGAGGYTSSSAPNTAVNYIGLRVARNP